MLCSVIERHVRLYSTGLCIWFIWVLGFENTGPFKVLFFFFRGGVMVSITDPFWAVPE